MLRRITATLSAAALAAACLMGAAPAANAAATAWMCTDPRTGWTVVTSNYSLVQYLYRGGYRCGYVRPV